MTAKIHKMPGVGRKNTSDFAVPEIADLWTLDVGEVTGHNLEARGREEVNRLLGEGWRLLHIYTLTYKEDGTWRERPMAILGRLRDARQAQPPVTPTASRHEQRNKTSRPLFDMEQTENKTKGQPVRLAPKVVDKQRVVAKREKAGTTRQKTEARDQSERIPYTLEPHPEL